MYPTAIEWKNVEYCQQLIDSYKMHHAIDDVSEVLRIADAVVSMAQYDDPCVTPSIVHLAEAMQFRTESRLTFLSINGLYPEDDLVYSIPCCSLALLACAVLQNLRGTPTSWRDLLAKWDYRTNGGKPFISTDPDVNIWCERTYSVRQS